MSKKLMRRLSIALLLVVCGSTANAANGILKVTSFPTGAEVHVDGAFTGKLTPMSVNLSEGEHEVLVQIPDPAWAPDTRLVTIAPGNNDLSVTLLPNLSEVWAAVTELQATVLAQQAEIDGLGEQLVAANATIAALQIDLDAAKTDIFSLAGSPIFELEPYISVRNDVLDDLVGPHVIFEGANLHVRSGLGTTESANGLGNLIVGYNERLAGTPLDGRDGSHNLVVGPWHRYTTYGAFVSGRGNVANGEFSGILGGQGVSTAGFYSATVSGYGNSAHGEGAVSIGGEQNHATTTRATVCGGLGNQAARGWATVTGGRYNEAHGHASSVSGGANRIVWGDNDWAAGGLFETD